MIWSTTSYDEYDIDITDGYHVFAYWHVYLVLGGISLSRPLLL